jgi:hypothetical protein
MTEEGTEQASAERSADASIAADAARFLRDRELLAAIRADKAAAVPPTADYLAARALLKQSPRRKEQPCQEPQRPVQESAMPPDRPSEPY